METSIVNFGFGRVRAEYEAVAKSDFVDRMAWSKNWESHLQYFFYQFCDRLPPKLIYDIGANIGFYSVFLAKLAGADARVVAFEPNAEIRALLARNIARNELSTVAIDGRVVSSGSVPLAFETFGDRHEESYARAASDEETVVATVTLDAVSRELGGIPDLIKCDAEGFDLDIVAGGLEMLAHGRTAVVLEFQPIKMSLVSPTDPLAALDRVESLGYRPYFFRGHNRFAVEELSFPIVKQIYDLWVAEQSASYMDLLLWPPRLPKLGKRYVLPRDPSST